MAFLNWPIKTYCFENLVIGDVACTTLRHTTMFTYSHANMPVGQSECAYYHSYFMNINWLFVYFPLYFRKVAKNIEEYDGLLRSELRWLFEMDGKWLFTSFNFDFHDEWP